MLANEASVHVWHCNCADLPSSEHAQLARLLSPEETGRASDFVFEQDRRRFASGRGFLRTVLAHYAGTAADVLAFSYGPKDKPELAAFPDLHFNLAHAGDVFALAVTHAGPVGIDVELLVQPLDAQALEEHALTPVERSALDAAIPAQRLRTLLDYWVAKEAALKAAGRGINAAQEIEIPELLRSPHRFTVRDRAGAPVGHGTLIELPGGHPAAVVCPLHPMLTLIPFTAFKAA